MGGREETIILWEGNLLKPGTLYPLGGYPPKAQNSLFASLSLSVSLSLSLSVSVTFLPSIVDGQTFFEGQTFLKLVFGGDIKLVVF